MESLLFSLSFMSIAFLIFISIKHFDKRLTFSFGLLFSIYLGFDDLVTSLPAVSPLFRLMDGDWNWSGKVYSLIFSGFVIMLFGIKAKSIGLTFKQNNLGASLIALLLFSIWGLSVGLLFEPPPPSLETLLFQAFMPGIVEEVAYRGIAPVLLLGLLHNNEIDGKIPWSIIFITAATFGVWHGLSFSNGEFSIDILSAFFPFVGSIAGGWLRFSSGSLVFPILAHSAGNIAFHLSYLVLIF